MSLTFLWTDILVWGLVISLFIWGKLIGRSPQVQQQWLRVFNSKVAMVSAVLLLTYVLFALLDSIHLVLNQHTHSLLDLALQHLIDSTERTYSAPFALTEYNKSTQVLADGTTAQIYLPLKHVNPQQSISFLLLQGLSLGLFISALLILLHTYWRSLKNNQAWLILAPKMLKNETQLPWLTAYITLTLVLVTFSVIYQLSLHYHVLGTDKVGGDVLYESLKSIRTGVLIGVLTTLVMLPVALILGISAGLFRGWVDDVIQYLYTTLNSIPGVLLIAAAVLVMQVIMGNHPDWFASTEERADIRLLFLIFILGLTSWTGLCRLLRAETLKISQIEFVTASRAFGVSRIKIIYKHILPNVMHIVLIAVVLDFSGLVLAEAVLSYVGVGVDPTMHSWGNMINQARLEMAREPMVWWSLLSAFFFMFILVLAANLFSDRVQFVLDPRNQDGRF